MAKKKQTTKKKAAKRPKFNFKTATPEQLRAEAQRLKRSGGDKELISYYEYHSDLRESGGLKRGEQKKLGWKRGDGPYKPDGNGPKGGAKISAVPQAKNRKQSPATEDSNQGLLPGFLTEINNPRTEELAREIVFSYLRGLIDSELESIHQNIKKKNA